MFLLYVDPGAGSYFVQMLIGGILGALVALKLGWRKLWAGIRRLVGGKAEG